MLPESVCFSELTLDPKDILTPRKKFDGPYPLEWVRQQFSKEYDGRVTIKALDAWLEKNIVGRWGSYCHFNGSIIHFVILFEQINDGLMFKLMDGQNEAFSGREVYF